MKIRDLRVGVEDRLVDLRLQARILLSNVLVQVLLIETGQVSQKERRDPCSLLQKYISCEL